MTTDFIPHFDKENLPKQKTQDENRFFSSYKQKGKNDKDIYDV